jgi:hypothetical protein
VQPRPRHRLGVFPQTLVVAVVKLPPFQAPPRPAEHVRLTAASSISSMTKESSRRAVNWPREHRLPHLRPSFSMVAAVAPSHLFPLHLQKPPKTWSRIL